MKVIVLSIYDAVPLYKLFKDCYYVHVLKMCYFFVPTDIYTQHVDKLPKHIVSPYPNDPNNILYEVVNKLLTIPEK